MADLKERVAKLFIQLEASQILLVEWETSLKNRLGYPLVSDGSLFFLVPDDQLQVVCDLAADVGLCPADEETLRPVYGCEFTGLAVRYHVDDSTHYPHGHGPPRRRLVFLPMSWTGIKRDELVPIPVKNKGGCQPTLPRNTLTVPLAATCAAFVRIAARETRGSWLRECLFESLSGVITYSLFDMSYEGDYMEFPPNDEPLPDKEVLEIGNAVAEMRKWVFRSDEEWMREALIQIITGKKRYEDLPYQQVTKKEP